MNKQNRIESGSLNGAEIRFLLSETPNHSLGTPSGKMITDSDSFSFVYLLEEEEGYSQIHFTQAVWPLMAEMLKSNATPVLSLGDETLLLTGIKDELMMLIYNIEGNDNYGEEFSSAVESAFSDFLQTSE